MKETVFYLSSVRGRGNDDELKNKLKRAKHSDLWLVTNAAAGISEPTNKMQHGPRSTYYLSSGLEPVLFGCSLFNDFETCGMAKLPLVMVD